MNKQKQILKQERLKNSALLIDKQELEKLCDKQKVLLKTKDYQLSKNKTDHQKLKKYISKTTGQDEKVKQIKTLKDIFSDKYINIQNYNLNLKYHCKSFQNYSLNVDNIMEVNIDIDLIDELYNKYLKLKNECNLIEG